MTEKQAEQVLDATIAAMETPYTLDQTMREWAGAVKTSVRMKAEITAGVVKLAEAAKELQEKATSR